MVKQQVHNALLHLQKANTIPKEEVTEDVLHMKTPPLPWKAKFWFRSLKNKNDWGIYENPTKSHQKYMQSLVWTAHKVAIIASHAHNDANCVDIPITSTT